VGAIGLLPLENSQNHLLTQGKCQQQSKITYEILKSLKILRDLEILEDWRFSGFLLSAMFDKAPVMQNLSD